MLRILAAAAAASALLAASASAAELNFTARLDGATEPTLTHSTATGQATISVDAAAQTVDLAMQIHGVSLDDLNDHVIHAGMGPVHLHLYAANGDISLLVPFPYGANYVDTADGFTVTVNEYAYAEGAALLRSEVTFDAFLATLQSDFVYLNIHTDMFGDGEISGRLVPAA